MALVWVYPKETDVVYEASSFVLGSASLDVEEITLNNIPITCHKHTNEQAFAVPIALKPGNNSITLRANTGESITRNVQRVAPLTLSEEAPLRPIAPRHNTVHTLLVGQSLRVELLAHVHVRSIWLELRTDYNDLVLQVPMVPHPVTPIAPHHEFHAQAGSIFGGLHVNEQHPPFSLETQLFSTHIQLDDHHVTTLQDGETVTLHYTLNHEENDDSGQDERLRFFLNQTCTLWRYPRHIETSEDSVALYMGSTTPGRRLALLPPPGTPFEVSGRTGQSNFHINTPEGSPSRRLYLSGGQATEHVGQVAHDTIEVAHTLIHGNQHTLRLMANKRFGVGLYPSATALQVVVHQAELNLVSVKEQVVMPVASGFGRWNLDAENPQSLHWTTQTPRACKGFTSNWKGTHLELHMHRLPPQWEDVVVVLDAGHGGDEPGTHALNGLPEKEFNLAMALKIKAALRELGLQHVYLTREHDIELSLEDRQRYALQHKADVCLSLHANALPDGRNPVKFKGVSTHTYTPWSTALGDALQHALITEAERPNDSRYISNFAMTRLPACQSALIEYGYFIHPEEYAELLKDDTQQRLAWATANAVKAHHSHAFDIV